MKRLFAAVLMVMMLFAGNGKAEINLEDLNETLGNYILFCDRVLEDELWVYGYVDAFFENRSFDNLNIARTAVQSALREIRSLEKPEYGINAEDAVSMMVSGVDVDAIIISVESIDEFYNEKIIRLEGLFDFLVMNVYYEPSFENMKQRIELYRQDVLLDAQSLVNMMNYILLQTKDNENTVNFWNYLKVNTTVVSKYMDTFFEDTTGLAESEDGILDEIAENNGRINISSDFRNVFDLLLEEAVQTGDVSVFLENSTEISGQYETFPEAWWMTPDMGEFLYIFTDPETEQVFIHTMGNEIISAPGAVRMTFTGVTGSDAVDYLKLLMSYGMTTQHELTDEDGTQKLSVIAKKGESSLVMIWTEEETIVYLSSPLSMTVPMMFYDAY